VPRRPDPAHAAACQQERQATSSTPQLEGCKRSAILFPPGRPLRPAECKGKWGRSWQITLRVLTDAMAKGGDVAKRAFEALMQMKTPRRTSLEL
jgi:hypothetical protein